ncbi:glycoside hydrolase family 88 protein [Sphingomonas sp.]|uniref:glycoside hydrolase family 88 protein n=2 Tax=unclassified Sphingomonas TaxID=196159 RepID=UPI0025DAAD5A|nr:glycoside hydrolase family 88 protein [Sphingomonas sp.]
MAAPLAGAPQSAATPRFDPARLPDRAQVLALLDRTAAAQIAALKAQGLDLPTAHRQVTTNWISATFLIGLGRLTRVSDASGGRRYLRDVAEHYNFGLLGAWSAHNMLDADNLAIGEVYQELYARSGEAGEIAPLRARLDYTGQYLGVEPAPKQLVWWWADAMFMAPPVFARAAAQLHDHSYLTAMDAGWWRTYDRLWSKEHRLYYRDERFVGRRTAGGKPVFWARGNGWVVAGLARVLDTMPAKFPSRQRYVETFTAMMAALAPLQRAEDGLWTASLLDPEDPPGPETTGSAFFTYAMAWGINHGVLDRATWLPRVQRAWAGLAGKVQPNGLLGFAQRAGDQPVPSTASDHALYGSGAFLLAGLEVMDLGRPVITLPVAEPQRDPAGPARLPIALAPRPADPARIADWERAMAERQAMIDLAYDPATVAQAGAAPAGPDGVAMPKITLPLTPPPPDQRAARASVAYAPYRFDDLLWENDRTAHRIYGPALQREEPPSSSAIDAWGKHVPWPFMERQLKTGKQHDYHGEGIDFYNAGTTRGAGGLGIWYDDKLWVSRNWATYRILKNGPDAADFEVDYAPWPVDVVRKVWETRRFTLPVGTNFTRMVSTLHSDKTGPLVVGIGIQKKPTTTTAGTFTADRARGRFSLWTPTDADKGAMGVAVMVDPGQIADVVEDADNYIVLVRVTPGRPLVYYMGATWSKSRDFHDRATWDAYVMAQKPDFTPPRLHEKGAGIAAGARGCAGGTRVRT